MTICPFLLLAGMYFNLESAMPAAPVAAARPAKKHKLSSLAKQDLFDAVRMRDCVRARAALAYGVPANAQDQDGNTALHMVVAPLIGPNDEKQEKESEEAFESRKQEQNSKRIQMVSLLMREHGADCTLKNKKGVSVLDALSIPFAEQRSLDPQHEFWCENLIPEEERLLVVMPAVMANLHYVQNPAHDWYDQLKKIMIKAAMLCRACGTATFCDPIKDIMRAGILMADYPTTEEEGEDIKAKGYSDEIFYVTMTHLDSELIPEIEKMQQEHCDVVRAALEHVVQPDATQLFSSDLIGLVEEHLYAYPEKNVFPRHIIELLSIRKGDYDKQAWEKQKQDITDKLLRFQKLRPHCDLTSGILKKRLSKDAQRSDKAEQKFIDLALEQDNDVLLKAIERDLHPFNIYEKAWRVKAYDVCAWLEADDTALPVALSCCITRRFILEGHSAQEEENYMNFLMRPEIRNIIGSWPQSNLLEYALNPNSYICDDRPIRFDRVALLIRNGVDIDFEYHMASFNKYINRPGGRVPGEERAGLLLKYLENPESIKEQLCDADKKEFAAIAQEREDNRKLDKAYSEKQKKEQAHHETQCAAQ